MATSTKTRREVLRHHIVPGLLALLFAPLLASSATFTTNLVFAAPSVAPDPSGRSTVAIAGEGAHAAAGRPVLPERLLYIDLPAGGVVTDFSATPVIGGALALPSAPAFAQAPQPVGRPAMTATSPDPAVFSADADYPGAYAELASVQERRDRLVAAVRLHPVQVNPVRRSATFAESISIEISYTVPRRARTAATRTVAANGGDPWEYLLVTSPSLANSFAPLIAAKEASGTSVKVVFVADVSTNAAYEAVDAPAAIRNCIRDGYENHGTKYVLLGGDDGIVPVRKAYASTGGHTLMNLVTDLYYACLDGSWDGDGDGIYGEPGDGDDGGEIDLLAEVAVGRAPVHNATEVTNFVAKTLAFPSHPRVGDAVFLAEYLGDGAQGGRALDPLSPTFLTHDVEWLDDRPSLSRVWKAADAQALLNRSPLFVAHMGHGSASSCLGIKVSGAAALANSSPFFLHSGACDSGFFNYASSQCFAEVILDSARGAAGGVMNTREGWYVPRMEWIGSAEFTKGFFEQAILHGKDAGTAHNLAREGLLAKVETSGDMTYRWCYFTATLFGDPQLAFPLPDPMAVVPEAGLSQTVLAGDAGVTASFSFSVRNLSETPLGWMAALGGNGPLELSSCDGSAPALGASTITASISTAALPLAEGTYTNTIAFTNTETGASATFVAEILAIRAPAVSSPAMGAASTIDFGEVVAGLSASVTVAVSNSSSTASIVLGALLCDGEAVSNGVPIVDFIGFDGYDSTLASFRSTTLGSPALLASHPTFLSALAIHPADTNTLFAIDDDRSALVAIDLADGCAETTLAPFPRPNGCEWTGLAFHPWDGNLYAAAVSEERSVFFLVDPASGESVRLAELPGAEIVALACDERGAFYGIDLLSDKLLRVDPFTGAATDIGPLGLDADYSQGLDACGGRLYWAAFSARLAGELRVLDPTDASCRLAGALAGTAPDAPWGEYEIAVRSRPSAFIASGADFPLAIPPGGHVELSIAFEPPATGGYQSTYGLVFQGASAPFASFRCIGRGVKPSSLPTGWLTLHGLAADGSADAGDPDGDGFTNAAEWLAGTDPADASSRLAVAGASWTNGGFRLEWPATPGHRYGVLASPLPAGPYSVWTNILATSSRASATDATPATNRFYRIQALFGGGE